MNSSHVCIVNKIGYWKRLSVSIGSVFMFLFTCLWLGVIEGKLWGRSFQACFKEGDNSITLKRYDVVYFPAVAVDV